MESKQPAAYWLLLLLSLAFTTLAVITLIPDPGASKPNVLGYKSVCTFAPAATLLCGLLAALTCTVRNRLVSVNRGRSWSLLVPAAAAVLLVGGAAASTAVYAQAQSHFGGIIARTALQGASLLEGTPDGTWIGTVTEADVTATVNVTVKADKITGLSLGESRNIEPSVARKIFDEVMSTQQTDVEAVSGATASSQVLLKAIEYALQDDR